MYLNNIYFSLILFIITSSLITVPIIISSYRKYGFFDIKEAISNYIFILYLQTIMLLVILPMPDINEIKANPLPITDFISLVPFGFVLDIVKHFDDVSFSIINLVKAPAFYQMVFNIMMFVPLGIFLRMRFKLSLKRVILYGFLVSLFFEFIQLTGLLGMYSRPYRVFDIDDLIINTLGTTLGYLVGPLFKKIFPNQNKQLVKSYHVTKVPRLSIQFLIFLVDIALYTFLFRSLFIILLSIITYFNIDNELLNDKGTQDFISNIIALALVTIFITRNKYKQTPAMRFMRYKMIARNTEDLIKRNLLMYLPFILALQYNKTQVSLNNETSFIASSIVNIFIIYWIIVVLRKNKGHHLDLKYNVKVQRIV